MQVNAEETDDFIGHEQAVNIDSANDGKSNTRMPI